LFDTADTTMALSVSRVRRRLQHYCQLSLSMAALLFGFPGEKQPHFWRKLAAPTASQPPSQVWGLADSESVHETSVGRRWESDTNADSNDAMTVNGESDDDSEDEYDDDSDDEDDESDGVYGDDANDGSDADNYTAMEPPPHPELCDLSSLEFSAKREVEREEQIRGNQQQDQQQPHVTSSSISTGKIQKTEASSKETNKQKSKQKNAEETKLTRNIDNKQKSANKKNKPDSEPFVSSLESTANPVPLPRDEIHSRNALGLCFLTHLRKFAGKMNLVRDLHACDDCQWASSRSCHILTGNENARHGGWHAESGG
jgi:hypothetical protein